MRFRVGAFIGIFGFLAVGCGSQESVTDKSDITGINNLSVAEEQVRKGEYIEYSEGRVGDASSGVVILYLQSGWCSLCKVTEEQITENPLPDNLTVMKLNFSESSELKSKYKITATPAFIQVDQEGELLKKWTGARFDQVLDEVIVE